MLPTTQLNTSKFRYLFFLSFHLLTMTSNNYDVMAVTANPNDSLRLYNDVIRPFNDWIRPVMNQSQAVRVYFSLALRNIIEIDEIYQRVHISAWANFSWRDEIRPWNPKDYNGIKFIHPRRSDVWRPETVLTNSVGKRDVFGEEQSPLTLYYNGLTRWYVGGLLYFVCSLDVTHFPFDSQTCEMTMFTLELAPEIEIILPLSVIDVNTMVVNNEWEVTDSRIESTTLITPEGEYVIILISITFKRRSSFYVINVMVPVMILSFLSLLAFLVPIESGERVSFSVTLLLALSVFMDVVSYQLPPSSLTFPYISMYILSLLCLSSLSVFIIACQYRLTQTAADGNRTSTTTNDYEEGDDCNKDSDQTIKSRGINQTHVNDNDCGSFLRAHFNDITLFCVFTFLWVAQTAIFVISIIY